MHADMCIKSIYLFSMFLHNYLNKKYF